MKKTLGTVLAITILAVAMFGAVGSAYAMADTGKGPDNGGNGGNGAADGLSTQDQIQLHDQIQLQDGTCDGTGDCLLNNGICDGTGDCLLNDGICDGTGDCLQIDPVPSLYTGANAGTGGYRGGRQTIDKLKKKQSCDCNSVFCFIHLAFDSTW